MQVATGGQVGSDPQGRVIVRALDNLNFTLREGDRLALLGHNGAGKSTLLRLLSGVYEPTSGKTKMEGHTGSLIDISLGIDPELTGRENIYLRGALLGMSRAQISERVDEIIDFSELGDFVDMPLRTYSTGMHLRLAFAVSTIVRPEILLLDEWLSVGDEGFKHKAETRMNELVQSTRILVIATHSRDLALKTCNRAILLEHGKVILDTSPDEACKVYFGE
ncbi:ABC transporter ATP-binding protein [Pseudomonas knackmussii]|uniref:ABC transporter ATP-binding protein n=1 Tax=Pseudomonas knackmussii TaxID=65741 RepID=UPI003F4A1BE4